MVISIAVIFTSCSGMLYTTIDVLRPAKVNFPKDINDVLIVNNSVPQPSTYGHKTELLSEKAKNVTINTDSLSFYALSSFSEAMLDKEFFGSLNVEYDSQNNSGDFFSVTLSKPSTIQSLAKKYGADGIIILNRMIVQDKLGEFFNEETSSFIAYIEAQYEYNWTINFPAKNHIFSLITKDTVYWESEAYSRKNAISSLPDRKIALIDGAIISGKRAVNQFIPYWDQEDRYFFTIPGKKFKNGLDSVYVKNWESAINDWEKMIDSPPTKKAMILHNLSVLYEIEGNIKKAYEYSNKALISVLESLIFDYKNYSFIFEQNENLQKRVKEEELLKKQLGEN